MEESESASSQVNQEEDDLCDMFSTHNKSDLDLALAASLGDMHSDINQPIFCPEQDTGSDQSLFSPEQASDTDQPHISPEQASDTDQPHISPQQASDTDQPHISLQQESAFNDSFSELFFRPNLETFQRKNKRCVSSCGGTKSANFTSLLQQASHCTPLPSSQFNSDQTSLLQQTKVGQTSHCTPHNSDQTSLLQQTKVGQTSHCTPHNSDQTSLLQQTKVGQTSHCTPHNSDQTSLLQQTKVVQTSHCTPHNSDQTSVCLKDKLKQKLKTNVGVVTGQKKMEADIRKEAIAQAKVEASQIRKNGTNVDIGPFYGLPAQVELLLMETRGISKLYDWQDECLQLPALKDGRNLIYSLPTSGGKTLVAEILMMREILCHKRDALFILPFVSIVQEKVRAIAEFAIHLGFIVEEYAGSKGRFPPIKRREKKSMYIATIEKAHSLVNSLIETKRINALGLIVVDELHMLGEGGARGSSLEALLLKALFSKCSTQIIGMSATLNNIADLQQFLCADVYSNNFRPVPLTEFVKIEDNIFRVNHQVLTSEELLEHEKIITFPYSTELAKQDPDHLLGLVLEIIPAESCLVFCSSKKNCENVALMLSKIMAKQYRHLSDVKQEKRKTLLGELGKEGAGNVCPVLEHTVQFGIGYHHSGLTMDERRLIEEAYTDGTLCLLTCTSTLAAGVNLPAKRVILRSPYIGMTFMKHSQYKQMVGRAGRAGKDSSGESFLIVGRQDRMKVKEMLTGPQDFCHSSLGFEDSKGVKMLILSAVGLEMVNCAQEAFTMMSRSLYHIQSATSGADTRAVTIQAIEHLVNLGLLIQTHPDVDKDLISSACRLKVSAVGRATFKGSLDHSYSCQLYQDLKTSESSLNLSTYLHLLFLVTPYDRALEVTPSWGIYFKKFCSLTETEVTVAAAVGVPENYLALRAAGRSTRKKVSQLTVNRFYLTLMLWDLWRQQTVWQVAEAFSQTRGFVQNLLSQAAAFASCVLHYCQELEEFWAYQVLLEKFVKRLAHCVSSELLPLMDVPGVSLARGKQLYAAGCTSVSFLAGANVGWLVNKVDHLSRRAAAQMISAAKNLLEEKRAALLEEVDSLTTQDYPT